MWLLQTSIYFSVEQALEYYLPAYLPGLWEQNKGRPTKVFSNVQKKYETLFLKHTFGCSFMSGHAKWCFVELLPIVKGRENCWKWSLTFPYFLTSLYPVGPLIGKYCGTKTPSELRSSTGILSLTFHTDMAVAKDGFSARYYLVHQEPIESELAGWEHPSCLSIRALRVCSKERPASSRGGFGDSTEFAMASEFREWELYPLARQRLMKIEQMLICVLTSLKEKSIHSEN